MPEPSATLADPRSGNLADLVWPEEAYARSTNLELGFRDTEGIPDYKFSTKSLRLLEEVLDGCQGQRRDRAWAVVGPYGSGKSTFGVFLLQLLAGSSSPWLLRCLIHLGIVNPAIGGRVQDEIQSKDRRYLPIIVQGAGIPLDLALSRGLQQAATGPTGDAPWASEAFLGSLSLNLQLLDAGITDSQQTVALYRQAASLAQVAGYQGLLVVVDEFGKFLERAAYQGELPDLLSAQYLAELASSQSEPQVLFIVLLHQGFQHYASSLSERQWLEWTKIQGRFRQIDFNEEPDNLYDLVARSLLGRDRSPIDNHEVGAWACRVWEQVRSLPHFSMESQAGFWPGLLPNVYPFHPLALYALPRLSSRLGQNERSLFTFLSSEDPLGLKGFLRSTPQDQGALPSLTLDHLFDFFLSGTRFTSLPPDIQRRVSEIESGLDRLGDRSPLDVRILKVIGAISVLRAGPSLPASQEVLVAALEVDNDATRLQLKQALDNLVARKIIVFRKFSGEYRLWQGSDFDFDRALTAAREKIRGDLDISKALQREQAPQPLMAHRHSFETGTTRCFAVIYLTASDALHLGALDLARKAKESGADGLAVYLLPRDLRELREVQEWAGLVKEPELLLALPKVPINLATLLEDLVAHRQIANDWPEIGDDPVATKELEARIEAAEELLQRATECMTDPGYQGATWYWQGQPYPVGDRRQLNSLLSEVCDTLYPLAPKLRNELVNRRSLSTAAVVAVKKVIDGLLSAQGEAGLGFTGNGPEVSIFRTLFIGPGLYRRAEGGRHVLCPPNERADLGYRAVWKEIEDYFKSCDESGKTINQLQEALEASPFGLRHGLTPLLIWTVLIYHRHSLCLYENGTYVREWSPEIFDRCVKSPETFAVRWLVLSGSIGRLLVRLNRVIPDAAELPKYDGGIPLSGFLQNLYGWYQGLPDYAKHTMTLPLPTIEVRRALNSAVDPVDLLLSRLPQALEFLLADSSTELLEERGLAKAYVGRFSEAILQLASAYFKMQGQVISCMADAFGTPRSVDQLRKLFQGLTPEISEHVRNPIAKTFLIRAKEPLTEDMQWVESIGATLTNQAPRFWMDHHYEEFADQISLVAQALSDAKRRAYVRHQGGPGGRRIIVEQPGGSVSEVYLSQDELEGHLGESAKSLLRYLEKSSPDSSPEPRRKMLAAALGLLAEEVPEERKDGHG